MRPTLSKQFEILSYDIELARIGRCKSDLKDVFLKMRTIGGSNKKVLDDTSKALDSELRRCADHYMSLKAKRWQESA